MSYLPVINLWCWHGTDAFVLIHRLKLQNKQNLGTVLCIILWSYRCEKASLCFQVFDYDDGVGKSMRDDSDSEDDCSSYHDDEDDDSSDEETVPKKELEWDNSI